jgi:hypothetical protein
MRKFALLDANDVVINVSVADDSWDSTGWIEYTDENPAVIGGDYVDDYFYGFQPFPSWTRNEGKWVPPIPYPSDGLIYFWNEEEGDWVAQDFSVA